MYKHFSLSVWLWQTVTIISCVYRAPGNEVSDRFTAYVQRLDGLTTSTRSARFTGTLFLVSSHRRPVEETANRLWRSHREALLHSVQPRGWCQNPRSTGKFNRLAKKLWKDCICMSPWWYVSIIALFAQEMLFKVLWNRRRSSSSTLHNKNNDAQDKKHQVLLHIKH